MEYAEGGELFDRIAKQGRFSERDARFYFQQLISGVHHCHKAVSHLFAICLFSIFYSLACLPGAILCGSM